MALHSEAAAAKANPHMTPGYKWLVVAMLWLISFFNYADRQAIFSVFPLLEREMHLTPVQLGLLGSAFAWVYGLGGPFAGMIVDRLSILALKMFHMRIEATRASADDAHRRKNAQKCVVLEEQHNDLKQCLQALMEGMLAGTRRYKLYRQFKMYNDPSLNPQLYQKSPQAGR